MNYANNRRSRRSMAKQFGLLKNQDSVSMEEIADGVTRIKKAADRRERARRIGEQIHLQHLETVYANQAKDQEALEVRIINSKVDHLVKNGMSKEEAEVKATADRKIEREKQERKDILKEYKRGH